jgi:hypothetical protein
MAVSAADVTAKATQVWQLNWFPAAATSRMLPTCEGFLLL